MVKTYGWQSPEQLKFINENPKVLSLLYDLSILPEEISARVRGYVEEETAKLNLQVEQLQNAVAEMLDEMMAGGTPEFFKAKTRVEALIEKRNDEAACSCKCHAKANHCTSCGCTH